MNEPKEFGYCDKCGRDYKVDEPIVDEPVAFIKQGDDGYPRLVQNPILLFKYESILKKYPDIPLYTHPMRELTDEEILDLCPPNHSEMMNEAYTIDFARAILKKASEK